MRRAAPIGPARRARWRHLVAAVVGAAVLALSACGGSSGAPSAVPTSAPADTTPTSAVESTVAAPPSCLEQVPVERLVRLLPFVLVSAGTDVSGMVDRVGGVGLHGRHGAESVAAIRAALDTAAVPPLLGSDEEGGTVQRLADVLGPLPSAARIGAMAPADARSTYDAYAEGLARLGVDVDFAPTLDVGSDAVGSRSYGDDPGVITDRAGSFVDALTGAGVLPVLKHFPGLGAGASNTDYGDASTAPLADLEAKDLLPYRQLLGRSPVGLMMSHALVPGLTGELPTSLSPAAYRYVADELGFHGLVVTDTLGAGAIATRWSIPEAAVLAVAAGADMVLFTDPAELDPVLGELGAAVADGRIPVDRLEDAASAVLGVHGVDPCSLVAAS